MAAVSGVMERFEQALDALVSADREEADSGGLAGLVLRLGTAQCRLDSVVLAVTDRFERCGLWRDDGARSAKAWIRTRRHMSDTDAAAQVRHARTLTEMPHATQALTDGGITRAHVAWFAKAAASGRSGLFARDERMLVASARTLSFKEFSLAIRHWIDLANDFLDIGEPDPADRRKASSRDSGDGMWDIEARLDALAGAEFDLELRRLERIEFDKDRADARDRLGDAATATDLARSGAQRLADALLEMSRRSASTTKAGDPARRILTLRMDYATFIAEIAQMTHDNEDKDSVIETTDPATYADRVSETHGGTIVAPSTILDPNSALHVRRAVFGPDGHILDFGRDRRLFTGGLREAIIERDRQCANKYCQTTGRKCQIDHKTEWEDNGHTAEHNANLLCGPDNREKHRRKRQQRKRVA